MTNKARWMFIFESLLITFEVIASFFEAAGAVVKFGSSLNPDNHKQISLSYACPNLWNARSHNYGNLNIYGNPDQRFSTF